MYKGRALNEEELKLPYDKFCELEKNIRKNR